MGKIISFFGADHKCGTSMISQCCAEMLSSGFKDISIVLIHTENARGNDYCPMVRESIDLIRPYLEEKLLDTKDVMQKCRTGDNLFIISGTERIGISRGFHPDTGEYFVKKLASDADVIICDCGAEIENGLSLGSLIASDFRYTVISQSEAALRRFEMERTLFEKLDIFPEKLIVNKYDRKNPNTKAFISERLNVPADVLLPVKNSSYGNLAEFERTSILSFEDKGFSKDIDALCSDIVRNCGYGGI